MIRIITGLGFLLSIVSCATDKNVPQILETALETKGETEEGKIGINKEGQVIIQEETDVTVRLRLKKFANQNLEDRLEQDHHMLKRCREDISDPRLGGNGAMSPLPGIDNLKSVSQAKEEFGLDEEGNLKFVSKEFYLERLEREQRYTKSLRKMIRIVRSNLDDCERSMASARVKHGLPAKRFQGEGFFDHRGKWVQTEDHEHSLDDAFKRMARQRAGEMPATY